MRPRPIFPAFSTGRSARSLRRAITLGITLLTASLATRPARAAWQPDGVPLSPLPTSLQSNSLREVVADGSNGAYAVWLFQQYPPDYSSTQYVLRAQRVDAAGNRPAPWPAAGNTIRTWIDTSPSGTYNMSTIGLYPDGSGGALLAAFDETFLVEFMTLFRLYHIAPGGAVTAINIANSVFGGYPVLEADADGDGASGAVMICLQQTFAPPPDPAAPGVLFAQRIDGAGAPLWPEGSYGGVELNTTGQTAITGVAALSDGAGGGFFAWGDRRDGGDPDLYVQHIDAAGAVASGWAAGGVLVCGAPGDFSGPRLVRDGAGGVIVVWSDLRSGTRRLYAHVVLAAGTPDPAIPVDGRQLPSSHPQDTFLQLVEDGQGGCFVARSGVSPPLTTISHLHRLDSAMQPRAGWPAEGIPLHTLSNANGIVGLANDGLGGAFVAYRNGAGSVAPQGLYAQHYAANGTVAPGWSAGGYRLSGTGHQPVIAGLGNECIVAWDDARASYPGIYAQRLLIDGPVPAELALVSASARADGVRLRWYSADGPMLSATIERRTGDSDWAMLTGIAADGNGFFVFHDATVTPGGRYGYRLVWQDGETIRTGGEAWVTVPLAVALAIEPPSPNPSSGAVTLAFTLPAASPARVEVFDLVGRRMAGRDVNGHGLGAGRHVVPLPEVELLPAGLYVLQLTQGSSTARTRFVRID